MPAVLQRVTTACLLSTLAPGDARWVEVREALVESADLVARIESG